MQPLRGSAAPGALVLASGLALLVAGCCPCGGSAPGGLLGSGEPDDSQVTFGSMEPSGPEPDAWKNTQPEWASQQIPYAHQASIMLEEAKPQQRGSVEHGLVLCDVYIHSGKRYDTFADPDPSATLTLGERPPLHIRGGEERLGMVFTAPGATAEEGEPWKLLLVDRDVTSNDTIGEITATYTGSSPLDLNHEDFRATCHVFPQEEVEPYAVEALKQADRALSSPDLERAPDTRQPQLGYPDLAVNSSEQGVGAAAALLTWRDKRVKERVKRLEKLKATWQERANAAIEAELQKSKPGGWRPLPGWEGLQARVTEARCRAEAGCRATLELKNTGKQRVAVKFGAFIGGEGSAAFIFQGGRAVEAKLGASEGTDGLTLNLAPGEQEELVYEQPLPGADTGALVALQFGKTEQAVILRLPGGA